MTDLNPSLSQLKSSCDILLLDLDGTLLDASNSLPANTRSALLALLATPHHPILSVCTGRPYGGVASQTALDLSRHDPDALHIYHGGALVRSANTILHQNVIPTQTILDLLSQSSRLFPSFALELYTHSTIYVAHPHPLAVRHAQLLGVPHQLVHDLAEVAHNHDIIKAQWILPADDLHALRLHDLPRCTYANSIAEVMPHTSFVTITAEHVDKGSAVRLLLHHLNLDPARAAAVGDSENDLPMLATVGAPFVMGNASSQLRALYPNLPHIDEGGVAPLLHALCTQRDSGGFGL